MGNRFPRVGRSIIITMKILVVVLALAALAQAEPEADPYLLYRGYYGYPSYGFYGHSAYGYGLPGAGYTHVSRLHKRDAAVLHTGSAAPGVIPPHLPVDGTQVAPTALTYGLHPASVNVEAAPIEATVKTVVHAPVAYHYPYAYGGFYGRRKREADAAVLATGSAVVGSLPHAYALKHPEGVIGPTALPGFHSAAVTGVTPGAITATVHHTYPYAHYPYHFGYAYGK